MENKLEDLLHQKIKIMEASMLLLDKQNDLLKEENKILETKLNNLRKGIE